MHCWMSAAPINTQSIILSLSVTQTLLVSFLPSSKNKEVPLFHFSAMELINHNDFFSQAQQQHSHIHRPNNGGRNDDLAGGSRPQVVHEGNALNVLGIQHPPPSTLFCGLWKTVFQEQSFMWPHGNSFQPPAATPFCKKAKDLCNGAPSDSP